ncbi:MAG: class I SAM-dependent methyltransferase [Bacteroidota bacterium]
MNPSKYIKGLVEQDGIWCPEKTSVVSYPDDGNETLNEFEEGSFWFNHRNDCITAAVKKFYQGELFFDIGGGNGFVASAIQKNAHLVVLIEPGKQGCLNAKNRGIDTVIHASLDNLSFENESVPSIGIFDVVEHIENDTGFLQQLSFAMEKNGYLFITVPAHRFLWSEADVKAGHFHRYTLREINKKLKSAGFRTVYSTYFFSVLPPAILLFRILRRKLKKKKTAGGPLTRLPAHEKRKGLTGKILNNIWKTESAAIRKGKKIPFGSSCLIVAQKNCG